VASVSGSSITLASGFAPTSTPSNLAVIYRLPAALVASVTTTSGSSTVKVTGGTYAFQSGDVVWSDAFPWGTLVGNAVGPAGAQTLNMTTPYMTANQLATVTHTAGSGKMWLAPAGIKRLTTQRTRDMYVAGFPMRRSARMERSSAVSRQGITLGVQPRSDRFTRIIIGLTCSNLARWEASTAGIVIIALSPEAPMPP
jgi:hypothetical protein